MKDENHDKKFNDTIRHELDKSIESIDASTQSRITQARYGAIERKSRLNKTSGWLAMGALTTACLVILVLTFIQSPELDGLTPAEEFELISEIDDLELLEELEFYEWLEEYELPT